MSSFGYIAAARLDPSGQRYQGDIFAAAPFLCPMAEGSTETKTQPAILLTPTCDFALKTGSDLRLLYAIEVFEAESPLLQQLERGAIPQHVVPFPSLDLLLPHGGAVLLRCSSPIHAAQLAALERATTLNEMGLRVLLWGHTRYYLRLQIDKAQIPLPPDDPRLLWRAIEGYAEARGFDNKRDAVMKALEVAIMAMAQHHGVTAPTQGTNLYRLRVLAEKQVVSAVSRQAIDKMLAMEHDLREIYGDPPQDKTSIGPLLQRCVLDLEDVGLALQEQDAPQFPEQKYRSLFEEQAGRFVLR